jgi:hypothetical protein
VFTNGDDCGLSPGVVDPTAAANADTGRSALGVVVAPPNADVVDPGEAPEVESIEVDCTPRPATPVPAKDANPPLPLPPPNGEDMGAAVPAGGGLDANAEGWPNALWPKPPPVVPGLEKVD